MGKVKAKAGADQAAAIGKVSGKKKKYEKKVLKVVSERSGAEQPAVSLKSVKKNSKKGIKIKKSGRHIQTHSDTIAKEDVPQEPVGESEQQQNDEKDENTPIDGTTSHTQKKEEPTGIITDKQEGGNMPAEPAEPENKNSEEQEPGKENTESGENESSPQGKKKRKRGKKRKSNEALEGLDNISKAVDDYDGEEDKTEENKASKRQKIEKKEDKESGKDENAVSEKSKKKKKKHVLFIGNLPFEATEEEVREHFKVVADDITRVTLMSREKSGKGKGYGFLELANAKAYTNALKLHLSQFQNRKINVEFTTPGKNTKNRKSFIKFKTRKLLGQKKRSKGRKKKTR